MDKSIEQLQEANEALTGLLASLALAKSERRSWALHDVDRGDGGGAQDARHDAEGERLNRELQSAEQAVKAQILVLKQLGDAL
ncbi:hypothetical protein ACTOWA_00190 [Herbaspirillum seropedicae]|uniref:hypothetical protein n=1 Tax=Herbaspirillum seropedicae TaxID=964 RepID=UPI0028660560|nr:hypothetical protein [Herbaspirillum seropedicae]MDR6397993.1 hypothetical protein [Herbaspirillum seropedicae]